MQVAARRLSDSSPRLGHIPARDRLIVALDVPTVEEAQDVVNQLGEAVSFYKIGMQLQFAGGLDFTKRLIEQGKKVFLDSKLLDIDQTITSAVRNIAAMGVTFLTVHGNGKTIKAAMEGRGNASLQILSVTVLTNLDAFDIQDFGFDCNVEELVLKRAQKAIEAGADGVIASGAEAASIRSIAGEKLKIVTPGIRWDGAEMDDQKRTATPFHAVASGADYIVVGRPILRASDRRDAVEKMVAEIANGLSASNR